MEGGGAEMVQTYRRRGRQRQLEHIDADWVFVEDVPMRYEKYCGYQLVGKTTVGTAGGRWGWSVEKNGIQVASGVTRSPQEARKRAEDEMRARGGHC